jgi:GxxExxY protein
MGGILYKEESYKIMGACFEVYKEMGAGFLEPVYQECREIELTERGIPFVAQRELLIRYKGRFLKQTYKPDFVCYDTIGVELKALSNLAGEHYAQLWNDLKATGLRLGLLVNFGHHPLLEQDRIVV